MPPPKKRARFAQSQRPNGSKHFSNGLLNDIESLRIDPNFIPFNPEDEDTSDSEDESGGIMTSFTIAEDEEDDNDEVSTEDSGSREEAAVFEAVQLAKKFWKKTLDQVGLVKLNREEVLPLACI